MKEKAKFYLFAGVFGTGVIALLAGAYFWDFAPRAAKPAGDGFVAASAPKPATAIRKPFHAPNPVSIGRSASRTPQMNLSTTDLPTLAQAAPQNGISAGGHTTPEKAAKQKHTSHVLVQVDHQLRAIRQDLRLLVAEQSRMDQLLLHHGVAYHPIPASPASQKSVPGWSVESIGSGQAWIEGPSGNTHVVQAGATLDGFKVLAVDPDHVLTTRGRIGY